VGEPSRRGFDLARLAMMRLRSDDLFRQAVRAQPSGRRVMMYAEPQTRVARISAKIGEGGLPLTVFMWGPKRSIKTLVLDASPPGESASHEDVLHVHPRITIKNLYERIAEHRGSVVVHFMDGREIEHTDYWARLTDEDAHGQLSGASR
jgi:hypothetical protein